MITFQLNGEQKQVCTDWSEPPFGQYLELLKPGVNEIGVLSIFTGVDKETLSKAKIIGLDELLTAIEFLKIPPEFNKQPNTFMGVTMPKDITYQALGPYIDSKNILFSLPKNDIFALTESFAKYCAIYVQAVKSDWTGYDSEKALALVPEVENQPAWEVVGLGTVFITKLLPLKKNTETPSQKKATHRKKSRRGLKS